MTGVRVCPRRVVLTGLLAAACALTVSPGRAATDRLAGRLDAATAADVDRVVAEARDRGLPAGPLISKALEGAAKGIPGARITAVVRAQAAALDQARASLGGASSEPELVAGAAALIAGVAPDSLAGLRSARRDGSVVIPLVVLADLVARRVPAAAASSAVLAVTRAGAADPDLLRLRQRVERDIAAGASPGGAALLRARTLEGPFRAGPTAGRGMRISGP